MEIGLLRGGLLNLDLGEGKTLISLLAPVVLEAKKPVLFLRGSLVGKTEIERAELARHWRIPTNIFLQSYQKLGTVDWADWLDQYKPDCVLGDEIQAVKNQGAAVSRRLGRFMSANPSVPFIGMTGTLITKSIRDFASAAIWALRGNAPVPLNPLTLDDWCSAMDETLDNEFSRLAPGELRRLADPEDLAADEEIAAVRRGFRQRLRETPGVISSALEGTKVEAKLEIRPLRYDLSPSTDEHFRRLRQDRTLPDGEYVWEASQIWQHARELALGFHQVWRVPAPEAWRKARRDWFSLVREVIADTHSVDTPFDLEQACDRGSFRDGKPILPRWRSVLAAWRAVRDSFTPDPVSKWHDDGALSAATDWMKEPGIVWTKHGPFGERLAQITGAKYYRELGFAADGSFIDSADPKRPIVVSVDANKEGRNLQRKWGRNLLVTISESASENHQVIGRTHRPLVRFPVVTVDVFIGCSEHLRAWRKALGGARANRDTVGAQNKLLIADKSAWPAQHIMDSWRGPRWDS
jgi:hypothetical protein